LALMTVMWVFLAGGLGSAARYAVGLSAAAALGVGFPYGTLIVNLTGCFALGMVVQLAVAGSWHGDVRAAIAAGFLGGFTTYSSFNQETLTMLTGGTAGAAVLNIVITLAGGLAAGALGLTAGRILITGP
jgi:fluoride exporter